MLSITTPAASLQLLSAEQLRVAAGLGSGDASQDASLTPLGLRIAAEIAAVCKIAIGAGRAPTLRKERLTETIRGARSRDQIILSRRHDVSIVSVTIDGSALTGADYEVEPESGLLYRLSGDSRVCWGFAKAIVVYDAGFETVPDELVGAASDLVRIRLSEAARDPMVRSESSEVPGVLNERTDYWVGAIPGSAAAGGIPSDVAARLGRFSNMAIG